MDVLGFEKLIYHYDKITKIQQDEPQTPVHITLSLGNYCNHSCKWCTVYAQHEKDVQHADYEKLLAFLGAAQKRGLKAVGYVGNGEPTAYPRFGELVKEVNALGIEQGMFTNGFLLNRYMDQVLEYFTYIRISLDAGSTPVHNAMHQVNNHFDRIIANLQEVIRRRKDDMPTVGIQFATHHENVDDLLSACRIAREIGVDYLSVKPVFNWGGGANPDRIVRNELTPEKLASVVDECRAKYQGGHFKIFFRPYQIESVQQNKNVLKYDRCVAGAFNLNLYEDGRLTCCSPHKVKVGTVNDDLVQLEKRTHETAKKLPLDRCPPSCRYHPMNELVDTVLHPERAKKFHKNFL